MKFEKIGKILHHENFRAAEKFFRRPFLVVFSSSFSLKLSVACNYLQQHLAFLAAGFLAAFLATFLAAGAFFATFLAAAFFLATVIPPSRFFQAGFRLAPPTIGEHSMLPA
jgi:hypothetical protein